MKRRRKTTDETLAHINPEAVVANGFEEGYLGFIRTAGRPTVALYCYFTCVDIIMRDEDFSKKQAVRFMEEFILEHNAGESTPSFAFWKDDYDAED